MSHVVWLERVPLELLHLESVADHGGLPGLRDEGLLESALGRPLNMSRYEQVDDIPMLAACYGVALAKNHPFMDGNKRAAFIGMVVFAELNGLRIVADQVEATEVMLAVASGEMDMEQLAQWLRAQIKTI